MLLETAHVSLNMLDEKSLDSLVVLWASDVESGA